jgi:hypothetical protein
LGWAVELELLVCDNGAGAAVLVVQDAVLEGAEEVAIGCLGVLRQYAVHWPLARRVTYLLSGFALTQVGVLECANPEGRLDGSQAALGGRSIGRNALLDSLGEACGREEKRSDDGGSAHREVPRIPDKV